MKVLWLSNSSFINPALVREWQVEFTHTTGWIVKADDFTVSRGHKTAAEAQADLSILLTDLNFEIRYT